MHFSCGLTGKQSTCKLKYIFKNIFLEDFFSLVLSQFKKFKNPPGNLKFNYLDIFQSLKLRISIKTIISISFKLTLQILWAVEGKCSQKVFLLHWLHGRMFTH